MSHFHQASSIEEATTSKRSKTMRRRSLFSTKSQKKASTTTKDIKKEQIHQTWSPEMFCSSPLSKLAGWESSNDGQTELARSNTPDLNTTLGTHRLGSLRITNGAASPEPSIRERRPSASGYQLSIRGDDYFTASEGSGKTTPTMDDDASSRPGTSGRSSELERIPEDIPTVRVNNAAEDEPEVTVFPRHHTKARPMSAMNTYSLGASSNPFLAEEHAREPQEQTIVEENNGHSHSEYDASQESPATPIGLAIADHEESIYSDRTPFETGDADQRNDRLSALVTLTGKPHPKPGMLSASSSVYSATPRQQHVGSRKSQTSKRPNPDSGYHSSSSVHTVGSFAEEPCSPVEAPSCNDEDQQNPPVTGPPTDTTTPAAYGHERNTKPIGCAPPPPSRPAPTPIQLAEPKTPTTAPPDFLLSAPCFPFPALKSRPVSEDFRKSVQSTSPHHASTMSSSQQITPKKLQKKRPQSERFTSAPLTIQTNVAGRLFEELPRVPSVVRSRYSDRMSKHPDMEHLERTYKSVSHSNSRDSLFSVDVMAASIHFPSPTRSPASLEKEDRGRKSSDRRKSRSRSRRGWFRSRSRKADDRQALEGSDDEEDTVPTDGQPIGVNDFGTVAASLGASPYDMARSPSSERNSFGELRDSKPLTHPHQLGQYTPRKKVGMDDKEASDFAMKRSRDLLEHFEESDPAAQEKARCAEERLARHRNVALRMKSHLHENMSPGGMTERQYESSTTPDRASLGSQQQSRGNSQYDGALSTKRSRDKMFAEILERSQSPEEDEADVEELPQNACDGFEQHTEVPDDTDAAIEELPGNAHDGFEQPDTAPYDNSEAIEDEYAAGWEAPMKLWRNRRQSVGQYLRHPIEHEDDFPKASPTSVTRTPLRQMSEDAFPMHLDMSLEPPQVTFPVLRAPSPSPSVRERAAAFEKRQEELRAQMPTRQAPSPYRESPPMSREQSPEKALRSRYYGRQQDLRESRGPDNYNSQAVMWFGGNSVRRKSDAQKGLDVGT